MNTTLIIKEYRKRLLTVMTLCCVAVQASAEDYPFGRVFTDIPERQQLDLIREDVVVDVPEIPAEEVVQSLKEDIVQVKYSGYIRRADGMSAIWIDGRADLTAEGDDAHTGVLIEGSSDALFRSAFREARLKPGQTWNVQEDKVTEPYQAAQPVQQAVEAMAPDVGLDTMDAMDSEVDLEGLIPPDVEIPSLEDAALLE